MSATDNLDINAYTLEEILNLFKIESIDHLTPTTIKAAKMKTLFMHPDKSGLPSEYFIFFSKAYQILLEQYQIRSKVNREVNIKDTVYDTHPVDSVFNPSIGTALNNMDKKDKKDFNKTFNAAFEKVNVSKIDHEKNKWFTEGDESVELKKEGSAFNANKFNDIKQQVKQMTVYKGVQHLYTGGNYANSLLYGDEEESQGYVCSDPFSKLKYDDIRKVHKDQPVMSISESDIQNIPQYKSVDEYKKVRSQPIKQTPLAEAEEILNKQVKINEKTYMEKRIREQQEMVKQHQQINNVFSTFLRLT